MVSSGSLRKIKLAIILKQKTLLKNKRAILEYHLLLHQLLLRFFQMRWLITFIKMDRTPKILLITKKIKKT